MGERIKIPVSRAYAFFSLRELGIVPSYIGPHCGTSVESTAQSVGPSVTTTL